VRSAAAEIADFPRVELVGIDERISVSGRAVSDVSHLLAELLENATSFSSPETAVVVSGAITKSGFVLAITDQGIGLTPERIAEANTLLRHPPVVGLALSRALGLHVVGALAKRHGIAVELRKASPVGTVALVALPKAILEARGRNEGSTPMAPVYSPDVDDDGSPMPLGARRAPGPPSGAPAPPPDASNGAAAAAATTVTWHPADEPPVEQWAREADAQQHAASVSDAPRYDVPAAENPVFSEPLADAAPHQEPGFDFGSGAAHATQDTSQDMPEDTPEDTSEEEAARFDDLPLPTRIPGHNMTHQPVVDEQHPVDESDPMRPYRVHELLTRHSQGVRRGLEHHDDDAAGRAGEDLS
jgi:hypothetical protein